MDCSESLEQWFPQLNPHLSLAAMRDLAKGVSTANMSELANIFSPYLMHASLEECHLLLQYAFVKLLGSVECELFSTAGQLLRRYPPSSAVFARAQAMQDAAFLEPREDISFIGFDVTIVSQRYILSRVVQVLSVFVQKRNLLVDARRVLNECERRLQIGRAPKRSAKA